jgi:hypothetical protein
LVTYYLHVQGLEPDGYDMSVYVNNSIIFSGGLRHKLSRFLWRIIDIRINRLRMSIRRIVCVLRNQYLHSHH